MNVAPVIGTEAPRSPHETQTPDPQDSNRRRQLRYASPDTSAPPPGPPPPQVIINTRRHHSSNARRAHAAMSASQPPAVASSSQVPGASTSRTREPPPQPTADGQNHDRMETDDESENDPSDSGSDGDDSEHEPEPEPDQAAAQTAEPMHPQEDEAMDTSPDGPPAPDPGPLPVVSADDQSAEIVRIGVTATAGGETLPGQPLPPLEPSMQINLGDPTQPAAQIQVAIQNAALDRVTMREELAEENRQARRAARERAREQQRENEGDGDDDSDDSSDEEDHPYWTNYKEDTSAPDERELASIEDSMDEVSALDHEHWEKSIFAALDDPEYIPDESGRITWTIKGVRGTPEKPNRERIMRSPSVLIGGLYWNIKFFPRGNDGTEQLSIYIECSPTPYEQADAKETGKGTEKESAPLEQEATWSNEANWGNDEDIELQGTGENVRPESNDTILDPAAPTEVKSPAQSSPTFPKDQPEPQAEKSWRVAAQIGCVIYNPDEPRVYASQKSCHSYYNDNPDWGWTRFHGPWDDIHTRKRFQRQALLRNDTLSFTAYIRTVKDETHALWWHPPKDKPQWSSLEMTGVRGFDCKGHQLSAVLAALSTWMHLNPILQAIENTPPPDPLTEPEKPPRPTFGELQAILSEKYNRGGVWTQDNDLPLIPLAIMMNQNGLDEIKGMDVVMAWENLRQTLNIEANGAEENVEHDLFRDILMLRQPDPFDHTKAATKVPIQRRNGPELSSDYEPMSVSETLDLASQHPEKAFRTWDSTPARNQKINEHPLVLQIELHRQGYNQNTRKWTKLTHHIETEEEIEFNGHRYSLYGMIVHSGDLESQEYYSVIRPGGPGSRWLKYAGTKCPRKVTVLTTTQALADHEGGKGSDTAIGYLVLYVRTDAISSTLTTPFDQEKIALRSAPGSPNSSDETVKSIPISIYFYGAGAFVGCSHHGICDPWSPKTLQDSDNVWRLEVPRSTKTGQIKEALETAIAEEDQHKSEEPLRIKILHVNRANDRTSTGLVEMEADERLYDTEFYEGCRFWLAGSSPDAIRSLMMRLTTGNPTTLSGLIESLQQKSSAAEMSEPTVDDAPPKPDPEIQPSSNSDDANADSDHVGDAQPGDGDTVMAEGHETNADLQQIRHVTDDVEPPSRGNPNEPEVVEVVGQSQEIICFVKIFDFDTQTLRGVDSFPAKLETKIHGRARLVVEKVLGIPPAEEWKVYAEHPVLTKCNKEIGKDTSFASLCSHADVLPSIVLVAQRKPTPAQ